MDVWSWICELPNSDDWSTESDPSPAFVLASSGTSTHDSSSTRAIQLRAEKASGSNIDSLVTFSVCLQGFQHVSSQKILWVSDTCSLSSEKPFLPLVLQLLQEIISRSPTAQDSTCPRSQLQKLKPDVVSWIMDSHAPESFSSFFNLVLLTRLFWLCACDAPTEVGSFYFRSLLAPKLEATSFKSSPALRTFFLTVGVDAELCFMRTLGYMLAKWYILREVGVGLQTLTPLLTSPNLGFSYATEAHGFWILKGYAPVWGMKLTRSSVERGQFPALEAKDAVLKYMLAHQQLEAVIQLEYTVGFYEGLIQVNARVDNLRLHVARLGYNSYKNDDDVELGEERHFPSRIRVWVGPEIGANYVAGLSLGRSTDNGVREIETQNIVKGSLGKSNKTPKMNATGRTSSRTRRSNWRWDQDAEGNAAVFDAVLHDSATGHEVAARRQPGTGGTYEGLRDRYSGPNRAFTKKGGLVLAGDEYGQEVGWRVSKEMEGSVLKWRIGGQVWLSYWPNGVKSSYFETRCVEWCDEVDLPLIPAKLLSY
ncbi:hypothetical protein PanWU01x14_047890 [Parasponia andersonii]|uniref:Uncharacterized protein n=1 Tax=Parasponia andersonii TaxID=3476 RepID=A0A2P5DN73_PARAD|nr:hypothetical protein PanWU01x14_047890 [Parasponia andersonii]